jgi:pyridoxal 5'-phosphate synthase pdxS subunit
LICDKIDENTSFILKQPKIVVITHIIQGVVSMLKTGTERVKRGMAEMQKGGVIMDVVNAEQARIAEAAGAVAVMALERVPSDIRAAGGVARMADPTITEEVLNAVSIPVMAKARIGHIVEARVLEAMGVDYIDESEVLTPADEVFHLLKSDYTVPFVCGARDLGEASRRIAEGASMLRTKGEPGTGNIVEAVRHMRMIQGQIRKVVAMSEDESMTEAKNLGAPFEVLLQIKKAGKLPVVNFAAGGIATPADAALMMELGADGVFVGSGIFKSENPEKFARAIVEATTHYQDYKLIAELSKDLGTAMKGIDISTLAHGERMQERGW